MSWELLLVFILCKFIAEVKSDDIESGVSHIHIFDNLPLIFFLALCLLFTICDYKDPLLVLLRRAVLVDHVSGNNEAINEVSLGLRAILALYLVHSS